jgi:hypothetical protein
MYDLTGHNLQLVEVGQYLAEKTMQFTTQV